LRILKGSTPFVVPVLVLPVAIPSIRLRILKGYRLTQINQGPDVAIPSIRLRILKADEGEEGDQ